MLLIQGSDRILTASAQPCLFCASCTETASHLSARWVLHLQPCFTNPDPCVARHDSIAVDRELAWCALTRNMRRSSTTLAFWQRVATALPLWCNPRLGAAGATRSQGLRAGRPPEKHLVSQSLVGSTANTVGLVNRPWNCWTLNTSGFRSSGGAIEPDSHESRHPLGARSPSCAQTRITPKKWHSSEEVQLVLM